MLYSNGIPTYNASMRIEDWKLYNDHRSIHCGAIPEIASLMASYKDIPLNPSNITVPKGLKRAPK